MEVVNWLDSHSGTITAAATVVLALITWRYVRLTREILEENRRMHLNAQKPNIRLFLRRGESSSMVLGIRNIGGGPAKNILFTVAREQPVGEPSIDETSFPEFLQGISYLSSGQTIEGIIDPRLVRDRWVESGPGTFQIAVVWEDSMGNEYAERFFLNSQLRHGVTEIDVLFDISNALRSINESLSSISQNIQKD